MYYFSSVCLKSRIVKVVLGKMYIIMNVIDRYLGAEFFNTTHNITVTHSQYSLGSELFS